MTEVVTWRKSSFSGSGGTGGGDCLEVALLGDDRFALRDSKGPNHQGPLNLPRTSLRALLNTLKGQ